MQDNIFSLHETKSWYSCIYKQGLTSEWCVQFDTNGRIYHVAVGGENAWVMYGPVFFNQDFSKNISKKIEEYYQNSGTEDYFWENVFIKEIDTLDLYIRKESAKNIYEFENLDDLRIFSPEYGNDTQNRELKMIANVFGIKEKEIIDIKSIKSGMTNSTFKFKIRNNEYLFRVPGEGTEKLINRKNEKVVYDIIQSLNIADEIIYFDDETGCKIAKYHPEAVNTHAANGEDVIKSMNLLRDFHSINIVTDFSFDIAAEIQKYILLGEERNSIRFSDYLETYTNMKYIITSLNNFEISKTLCHIDCNPDNFIKISNEKIKLIDWEYAGMADPLLDVAMYAIYSYYSKERADELLRIYFQREPDNTEIMRLYAYMSLGGYLWALWTEYKQSFGVEFGEYGMKMYRYAKDYYFYFKERYEAIREGNEK
jgi:thiamine kinase-like enzyme